MEFSLREDRVSLEVATTLEIPCAAFTRATFELTENEGSFGSGVLTLERSIANDEFESMPTATTYSSAGIQTTVDCTDVTTLRLSVTSTQAGADLLVHTLLVDDTGTEGGQ